PAAISVGSNPTFGGTDRTVEAYALDRDDLDLYGVHVAIEFADRIRGQIKFESVDELIAQMRRDVSAARARTSTWARVSRAARSAARSAAVPLTRPTAHCAILCTPGCVLVRNGAMANISVVASVSSYVVTAGVALMALDLLQPAPRRRLVVNQPALVCMTLLSVFVLLVWAARAGLLPEQAHTLVYVHQVLLAGALITAFFALLPPSQPLRLGNLLVKQGDLDGAAAAYRRVLDAGRGSRIRAAVGRGET